jgi:hypothetical protein
LDPEQAYQQHVLSLLTRDTPVGFWRGYQDRARALYQDVFSSVSSDPRLNTSQRLSKLWQERHFAMEWLLIDEAKQNGVPASDKMIIENNCVFSLVGHAGVKMTQKYVREHGSLPSPAKFRKQLAAVNAFYRQGGLLLGDEPDDLYLPPEINGIVLHSPVGPRFIEEHQALGAIGFYVPYKDFRGWAVQLTFIEILGAYEALATREDRVRPTLRKMPKRGNDE